MTDLERLGLEEIIKISEREYHEMIELSIKISSKKEINIDKDVYPVKGNSIPRWINAILNNSKQQSKS